MKPIPIRFTSLASPAPSKDDVQISFSIPAKCDAATNIPRLLYDIMKLGQEGASRGITIEDGDLKDGGDLKFGFDGDGSDKINDLKVNGKKYKPEDKK